MDKRMEDWKDLRYGMFIHWGLYALLGRGEWVMWREAIDKDEYRKLADRFTAEKFDARAWARTAKEAGMKYMVLTTRHHDGFSLWDSPGSVGQFDAMHSAARRDFVKEYVSACREAGLKVGFYYSPLDWRFPGFFFPRMYAESAAQLRRQTFDQVRELLTNYGKIDILWFDGGEDHWLCHGKDLHTGRDDIPSQERVQVPDFWRAQEMHEMIHALQPDIVVSNRYGMRQYGDFTTPEGKIGPYEVQMPWESCITLNGSWGYVPGDPMTYRACLTKLAQAATGDGNLLLNVGPRPDGVIPEDHAARLKEVGGWLEAHGESIYGTRGGPFRNDAAGGMTCRDSRIYIHVWDWPQDTVRLPRLDARILSVSSPTTASLRYDMTDGQLRFSVDAQDRLAPDTLVVLELDRPAISLRADIPWRETNETLNRHEAMIV